MNPLSFQTACAFLSTGYGRAESKKTKLKLDCWIKEVAPTPELRQWFGHKPGRFAEFSQRYRAELAMNFAVTKLRKLGRGRTVTLIYAARDPKVNHAVVLKAVLQRRAPQYVSRH